MSQNVEGGSMAEPTTISHEGWELNVDNIVDRLFDLQKIRRGMSEGAKKRVKAKSKRKDLSGWVDYTKPNPLRPWVPNKTVVVPFDRWFMFDDDSFSCDTEALLRLDVSVLFLLDGNEAKWAGSRYLSQRPKGFTSFVTHGAFFESHYREIGQDGEKYINNPAVYKEGKAWILSRDSKWLRSQDARRCSLEIAQTIAIQQGIIEDAASLWTAEITYNGQTVIVGTYEERLKELTDLRDGPMSASGKRKAILHWVSSHIRALPKKDVKVSAHPRGLQDFEIADYHFSIAPPLYLLNESPNPGRFSGHFAHNVYLSQKAINR